MTDDLGDRIKANYENRYRLFLPRRTYTIIRVDGKAFHNFTRTCKRPFDEDFAGVMDATAVCMCEQIEGVKCAFVQSDEISLLLTDFESTQTQAWFDGNLQKLSSVSASIVTAAFNSQQTIQTGFALFDSRVFIIPDRTEVENYFIWRQQDATRNSISMAGSSCFSPKQLHQKSTNEVQEMLFTEKGINWNDYPEGFKRGRVVSKVGGESPVTYTHKKTGITETITAYRTWWESHPAPIFTKDRNIFLSLIPSYDGVIK